MAIIAIIYWASENTRNDVKYLHVLSHLNFSTFNETHIIFLSLLVRKQKPREGEPFV